MNKDTKEWEEKWRDYVESGAVQDPNSPPQFLYDLLIPKSELEKWVEKNKIPPQHRDWGIDVPREETHNRALADLQDKFLKE